MVQQCSSTHALATMTAQSKVYIAGVGVSSSRSGDSAKKDSASSLVSAATKALLDAGITYDNVTRGVRRKSLSQAGDAFKAFGDESVRVSEVDDGSELSTSFTVVRDRGERSVLVIAADEVCVRELQETPFFPFKALTIDADGSHRLGAGV